MQSDSVSLPTTTSAEITPEERTLAALAHASPLLNFVVGGVGGLIGALVLWLTQKDKSEWVAFHALQSLVFQGVQVGLFFLIVLVPWMLGFVFSFITFGLGTFIAVPIMILLMFVGIAIMFGGLAYSLYGAAQVYNGQEFRYYWVADWLEQRTHGSLAPGTEAAAGAPSASVVNADIGRIILIVVGGLLVLCVVIAACVVLFTVGINLVPALLDNAADALYRWNIRPG